METWLRGNLEGINGRELTCEELLYHHQMNRQVSEHAIIRLLIDKVASLEEKVDKLKEANNLFDGE